MKITFHGAARTVTGSMHLLENGRQRILLDCGLFQGRRAESFQRNRHLPFDARRLDALILSHAHIDHSGNIPNLVRSGFDGHIYCTAATRDLCGIMLRDSGHIQEQDVAYVNRKRARRGEPPVEPIYTIAEAETSLKHFVDLQYHRWLEIGRGLRVCFYDAGHILGSSVTVIEARSLTRTTRIGFTGDLGRIDLPILRDPEVPAEPLDALIMESTYGNRRHAPIQEAEDRLASVVNETARRGGKVIIPAFAVERTQEIVYSLHRLTNAGRIPALPIFVDSPLAISATGIFRLHPECFDDETNEFLRRHPDPFGFERLRYTREVEESKAINDLREPCVVISASGMCEAGRILHHLKNNIEDARNTVLIVSYQAPNTLGRQLVERQPVVRIFGEEYQLRAQVEIINAYSSHADRDELLGWLKRLPRLPKQVFVVHGDEDQARPLAEAIRQLGVASVHVPITGESHTV